MKNTCCFIVLVLSLVNAISQETIELKLVPFSVSNQPIYIERVIDSRAEKQLGIVEDLLGRTSRLSLKDGAPTAVKRFMDTSLYPMDDKLPICIQIKALEIQQEQTSIDELTTSIYTRLSFSIENDSSSTELLDISHYEEEVFSLFSAEEIYDSHEKRIRAALEYCMTSLLNDSNFNSIITIPKPTQSQLMYFSSGQPRLEDMPPLGKWFDMLTFKRVYTTHDEGWEVSYIGFADSEKDFIIPFKLSYGQTSAKSDLVREHGYRSIDSYTIGSGLNGYIKIVSGLYVDIGLNVPIGVEILRDLQNKKSEHFLIGIGANQGIKIIPWEDFGIVIGANFLQQVQTSKVYTTNLGFELELGVNF